MDVDQLVPTHHPKTIIVFFHTITPNGSVYFPDPSILEVDPSQIQIGNPSECFMLPRRDSTLVCVLESGFHEKVSGSEYIRRLATVREKSTEQSSWSVGLPYAGEDDASKRANESFLKELLGNTRAAKWTFFCDDEVFVAYQSTALRLRALFPQVSISINEVGSMHPQHLSRIQTQLDTKPALKPSHCHSTHPVSFKLVPSQAEAENVHDPDAEDSKDDEERQKKAQWRANERVVRPIEANAPDILLPEIQDVPPNSEDIDCGDPSIEPMKQEVVAPADPKPIPTAPLSINPAPEQPKSYVDPMVLSEEDLRCIICYGLSQSSQLTECCGHIVCPACSQKITRCPICRKVARFVPAAFLKRYFAIAQSRQKETCSCGFTGTEEDFEKHQMKCPNRKFYCSFCNVLFPLQEFKTHLKELHGRDILLSCLRLPQLIANK